MSVDRGRRAGEELQHAQLRLASDPTDAEAWFLAAEALVALGREGKAVDALRQGLQHDPEHPRAWLRLGTLHARAGRRAKAEEAFRQLTRLAPEHAEGWMRLGTTLFRRGQVRQAEEPLRRALALQAGLWPAAVCLATVLERTRRVGEAEALLAPLARGARPPATVAMSWAGLCLRTRRPSQGLGPVLAALEGEPSSPDLALLLHAKGDLHDALGEWEPAFEAHQRANRLRGFRWDPSAHSQRVDTLIEAFAADTVAEAPRATRDGSAAVLVVGMPRSGTSLLEQALSCHAEVAGAGELDTLRRVGQRISVALGAPGQWFHQPLGVDAAVLDQGADAYLQILRQKGGSGRRVSDKMPDNFLQLGLAAQMLPGCRVVWMRRNPLDVGWSCFRQPFGEGLAWSCSLQHVRAYFEDQLRIMAHWRDVLPLPLLELHYEDLVREPEDQLRRVLSFLELDWDPACLSAHRSERLVTTASHAQVQEPLHGRFVGRAAPYRRWLGALEALE